MGAAYLHTRTHFNSASTFNLSNSGSLRRIVQLQQKRRLCHTFMLLSILTKLALKYTTALSSNMIETSLPHWNSLLLAQFLKSLYQFHKKVDSPAHADNFSAISTMHVYHSLLAGRGCDCFTIQQCCQCHPSLILPVVWYKVTSLTYTAYFIAKFTFLKTQPTLSWTSAGLALNSWHKTSWRAGLFSSD